MKTVLALLLLFTMFYMPAVRAQCGYAANVGGQCVPPDVLNPPSDSNQRDQPQQPPAVWSTRWGAIAEDPQASAVGTVAQKESKSKAEGEALILCTEHGGKDCKIALTYYNQCAAVAVDEKNLAVHAHAATKEQAEHLALTGFDRGDISKIVYSACSLPVRVQ